MAGLARRVRACLGGLSGLAVLAVVAGLPVEPVTVRPAAVARYDAVPLTAEPGTLIAVTGNIACGRTSPAFNKGTGTAVGCAMRRTSDMVLAAGDAVQHVLAVGDLQYEHGEWADLQVSYDPTWGRLKAKTKPVPGSHEYSIAGAPDYYRYWGERAFPDRTSNYSFEIDGWDVYALNSACVIRHCSPGGKIYEWLKGELAGAPPDRCQMAYWHHPIVSLGQFGNNVTMPPMAELLHDAGVDLIVNAHDHNYQRWARITPEAAVDHDNGYRNIIVGSGGVNHHRLYQIDPVRHAGFETGTDKEFGVLFMKLNPQGYAWEYRTLSGTYTDTGKEVCKRSPGTAAAPVPPTAPKPEPKGQPVPGNPVNLPHPPGGVTPVAEGATLRARWSPPSRSGTAGAVEEYRISVYGSEPGHPSDIIPIAQRTVPRTETSASYDMSGRPGWSMRITVEARNPDGWGNPAVLSGAVVAPSGKAAHAHAHADAAVPAGWTALPPDYPLPPITHPDTPRAVQAAPGNGSATVSWRAAASDGGSPLTGYVVYANPGGLVASVGAGVTSTTVRDLVNDNGYRFQVAALNDVAESAPTNETAVVTPSRTARPVTSVPGPPRQVRVKPGNGEATVTWSAPEKDGGASVTSYTVTSSPAKPPVTVDGTTFSARVDGMRPGVAYTFRVTAKNPAGTSPPSAPSTAVRLDAPRATDPAGPSRPVTVPAHPRFPTVVAGDRSATVRWTPPASDGGSPVTGYIVTMVHTGQTRAVAPEARSVTFGDLIAGTAYRFTVIAVNKAGRSAPSDETLPAVPLAPATAPSPPRFVVAAAGDGYAKVAWTAPAGDGGLPVTSYRVTGPDPELSARVLAGAKLEATIPGLTNGAAYTFTVTAENKAGLSARSAASLPVTPESGAPDPVMPVSADPGAAAAAAAEAQSGQTAAGSGPAGWIRRPGEHGVAIAATLVAMLAVVIAIVIVVRRRPGEPPAAGTGAPAEPREDERWVAGGTGGGRDRSTG